MPHIPIDKKPLIFDDPEFCDDKIESCRYLNGYCCHFFVNKDDFAVSIDMDGAGNSIKCDECKEEWEISKNKIVLNIEKMKEYTSIQCYGFVVGNTVANLVSNGVRECEAIKAANFALNKIRLGGEKT